MSLLPPETHRLRFSVADFRQAWPRLGERVAAFLQQHEVDTRAVYATELVLEEWITNVLRHGASRVDCELTADVSGIELLFCDDGPAFDPMAAVPAERPTSLASAVPGGLGLTMMRRAARAMHYRREGATNELRVSIDTVSA